MAKLLAGAAMRKITPSLEQLKNMAKENPKAPAYDGIHEDIYIRVIVLSDGETKIMLSSSDLPRFPAQHRLIKRLNSELGIDTMGCLLACTHNHEGIHGAVNEDDDYTLRRMFPPTPAIEEWTLWAHDQVVDAAKEAIANLKPARMGVNKCNSYINANRDLPTPIGSIQANNFHAPSDHELIVLRFEDLKGEPIALFVNHATHSNFMVWNLNDGSYPKIMGDVGGGVSRFVEKAYQNRIPVLWAIGAAGDQNPITRSKLRTINIDDTGRMKLVDSILKYEDNLIQLSSLCCTQGMEVLELDKSMSDFTEEFSFKGAEAFREIPGRKTFRSLGIEPMHGKLAEPVPSDTPVMLEFRLLMICGVAIATANCEAYTRLGMIIKAILPVKTTVFAEECYSDAGYIMDAECEPLYGYGTIGSYARSGKDVESAFLDAFEELMVKVGIK